MYARMIRTALLVLMCSGCLASVASAHGLGVLGSGRPEECAAELTAVFGRHSAFSAVAHVTEKDQAASAARTKEMAYYFLDGKLRIETDVAKSSEFSPEAIREMQTRGTDRSVQISDFGKRTAYLLFPLLSAYSELPQATNASAAPKIEKAKIAEETVEGHPCAKHRIAVTEAAGQVEIFTWEAADLGQFPIQVQIPHGDVTYTIQFRKVTFAKPGPSLFEPPSGYRRYETLEQLHEAASQRKNN